ncbi:MAG TPA: class I SAM-dependent methyltransferase [Micromonosporaceae bacterium]|jgi:SAM-dependent methyltransferase
MDRSVRTVDDVLRLLDGLLPPQSDRWTADGASRWDAFYNDRSRPVPFFVAKPDESLASHLDQGRIVPGRALDLGCGPGRNALYLAAQGFEVNAVDLSPAAIAWAEDRARDAGAEIRFRCGDAFATEMAGPYDLICDSGCFHHLPPHRRVSYLALVERVLAPGGQLFLTCFTGGEMGGSELSDADLYRQSRLPVGFAYTPESLRYIFSDLIEVEIRRMRDEPPESALFGEAFLWTALFRRPADGATG